MHGALGLQSGLAAGEKGELATDSRYWGITHICNLSPGCVFPAPLLLLVLRSWGFC